VLVAGAGRIGQYVVRDARRWAEHVVVADRDRHALERVPIGKGVDPLRVGVNELDVHLNDRNLLISCLPYRFNEELTEQCIATETSMVDLGGSTEAVCRQLDEDDRAKEAGVTIVPDGGLSPGITNVLAADLVNHGYTDEIRIRVGGLPLHPEPPLNYQLVFSVEGLVEEYTAPVLVLDDGRVQEREPLTELESIRAGRFRDVGGHPLPDDPLVAFLTSGGSSTLPYTYEGTVDTLNDKSIRYHGHLEQVRELVQRHGPNELTDLLRERLKEGHRDVVLLSVTGRTGDEVAGFTLFETFDGDTTAMMKTTGAGICAVAELLAGGAIPANGVLKQENHVPPGPFLDQLRKRGLRIRRFSG